MYTYQETKYPVPGSEIVGSAELRKRKHEKQNKTPRQLFVCLFLSRLSPFFLRIQKREQSNKRSGTRLSRSLETKIQNY